MPAIDNQAFVTRDPGAYSSYLIGTAVSTGTVSNTPVFFKGILFPNRVASGSVILYDSAGTSTNVIGTVVLGTQTNTDPPPLYEFNLATTRGLTAVNSANLGAIIFYK